MAREAGLDPVAVEAAAREVTERDSQLWGRSVFRRWRRRAEERLTAAVDRISLIVREEADRPEREMPI